jgi:hypothetical protein
LFFCVIFISNNYISTSYNGCKLVFHLVWTLSSWYINSEYGTGRRYPFFPLLFWIILWDLSPRPKVGAFPSMRTWFQMHVKSTTYNLSLIPHPPHPPKKKKNYCGWADILAYFLRAFLAAKHVILTAQYYLCFRFSLA